MRCVSLGLLFQSASAARSAVQSDLATEDSPDVETDYSADVWKALVAGTACPAKTLLTRKGGEPGGTITCTKVQGNRHFKFPHGKFDIDEQVNVPAGTVLEGNANPNDPSDKRKKPDPAIQTFFVATAGVTDAKAPFCGTGGNLKQGEAQKLRFGFLLNSNTVVKNINYQGKDKVRPDDNGSLCGGAVFETPGCVSPGFSVGNGTSWLEKGDEFATGCYDGLGEPNDLLIGDGKGVENVSIENVRLNDLFLPLPRDMDRWWFMYNALGSQIAVWVAQTQDGSASKNVHIKNLVSMTLRGDGINFHGNVQDSTVEDCHIEATGDDIYAVWGGYTKEASGLVFRNNVGMYTGITRVYAYGVCIAVYGAKEVEFVGNTCYDEEDWNPKQDSKDGNWPCYNGPFCNSCMAYIHGNYFGAIYPEGNAITLKDNKYMLYDGTDITDRPLIRRDKGSVDNIVTDGTISTTEHTR